MAKACTRAYRILQQEGSAAAMYRSFTQYLAALLGLWNDLTRLLPNNFHYKSTDNMLGPLLLPGARLAAIALQTYAGPDAAAIAASNGRLSGYNFLSVFKAAASRQRGAPSGSGGVSSWLAAAVLARSLCVAEKVSMCAYFFFFLKSRGTAVPAPGACGMSSLQYTCTAPTYFCEVSQAHRVTCECCTVNAVERHIHSPASLHPRATVPQSHKLKRDCHQRLPHPFKCTLCLPHLLPTTCSSCFHPPLAHTRAYLLAFRQVSCSQVAGRR